MVENLIKHQSIIFSSFFLSSAAAATLILLATFDSASSLTCYSCQSGYTVSVGCSDLLSDGMTEDCNSGPNDQCYEAIKWFQNGAIQLVERRCWSPTDENSNYTDYCDMIENSPSAAGLSIKKCQTCRTDLCNNEKIIETNAKSVCY